MAYRKRKIPAINSSSSADIAFLLLIFFLVTSSFDPKTGIYRKMSVPPAEEALIQRTDIQQRNLLSLTIDADNRIIYNQEEIPLKEIRELSKTFIAQSDTVNHVISLEVDRDATYQTYLSVLSELTAAYNELRHEAARTMFHMPFLRLTPEQKETIRTLYPMHISETEALRKEEGGTP
jgi:biopolymer transport protein ExbD